MQLIISYADGRRIDAVVASVSEERMRIFVPGCDDAVELRLKEGRWVDGEEVVTLDAVITASDSEVDIPPMTRTATGGRII